MIIIVIYYIIIIIIAVFEDVRRPIHGVYDFDRWNYFF